MNACLRSNKSSVSGYDYSDANMQIKPNPKKNSIKSKKIFKKQSKSLSLAQQYINTYLKLPVKTKLPWIYFI